ncbi:MAG: LuxR C-terminal-related transcriptional regulator [Aureliella sp.]
MWRKGCSDRSQATTPGCHRCFSQERQRYRALQAGQSPQLADTMQLSPKTIETYRARIKEKLELADMASLSREATQWVLENS